MGRKKSRGSKSANEKYKDIEDDIRNSFHNREEETQNLGGQKYDPARFAEYLQSIEFEDLDLIEHQMKMVADHARKLKGGRSVPEDQRSNGEVTVPLIPCTDKVFDDMPHSKNVATSVVSPQRPPITVSGGLLWGDEKSVELDTADKWLNIAKEGASLAAQGMDLAFIAPEVREGVAVAKLQHAKMSKMQEKWEYSVMVFVVGDKPVNYQFQRYVKAQWPSIQPIGVLSHKDGYFIMRLKSEEDLMRVLEGEGTLFHE